MWHENLASSHIIIKCNYSKSFFKPSIFRRNIKYYMKYFICQSSYVILCNFQYYAYKTTPLCTTRLFLRRRNVLLIVHRSQIIQTSFLKSTPRSGIVHVVFVSDFTKLGQQPEKFILTDQLNSRILFLILTVCFLPRPITAQVYTNWPTALWHSLSHTHFFSAP